MLPYSRTFFIRKPGHPVTSSLSSVRQTRMEQRRSNDLKTRLPHSGMPLSTGIGRSMKWTIATQTTPASLEMASLPCVNYSARQPTSTERLLSSFMSAAQAAPVAAVKLASQEASETADRFDQAFKASPSIPDRSDGFTWSATGVRTRCSRASFLKVTNILKQVLQERDPVQLEVRRLCQYRRNAKPLTHHAHFWPHRADSILTLPVVFPT